MDALGKNLFSGKVDISVDVYHPEKSVAITIPGLSHPVFASWKAAYEYTGGIKTSEKRAGKTKVVAKKVKASGGKAPAKKEATVADLKKQLASLKKLVK